MPHSPYSSPAGGDPATPWDVGVEWLTGSGPRHHEFRPRDPFTELLQPHEHIEATRIMIANRVRSGDLNPGRNDYYLGGWQGVPKYFRDYSTLLTFGRTGNLAVTYLGSYRLDYCVTNVDANSGTAEVLFRVENESTLASATHPPVIGYTPLWDKLIGRPLDNLIMSGPMSKVTQSFYWTETIEFNK